MTDQAGAHTPEPIYKAVERALDECSAWIARPNDEVTRKVALAAGIAWSLHEQSSAPAMTEELERLRKASADYDREIQQILGRALGYPKYCDDLENFPDATEADGVCVGDHVAVTLAKEVAKELERYRAIETADARAPDPRIAAGRTKAHATQDAGDVSSLIAARVLAADGRLVDCPVCGAVDQYRAKLEGLLREAQTTLEHYACIDEADGDYFGKVAKLITDINQELNK